MGADGAVLEAVGAQFGAGAGGQFRAERVDRGPGAFGVQLRFDGLFAHGGGVGESDAVRGQHPGQRWHEDGVDAECVGDGAGVLTMRRRRSR